MLWIGLACGVLLLLGIAGAVAAYSYGRAQLSKAESAIAIVASAADSAASALPAPSALTPSCAKAIACCQATMGKTAGENAAAAERACTGIGLLSDDVCLKQYEAQKRAAAMVGAACP